MIWILTQIDKAHINSLVSLYYNIWLCNAYDKRMNRIHSLMSLSFIVFPNNYKYIDLVFIIINWFNCIYLSQSNNMINSISFILIVFNFLLFPLVYFFDSMLLLCLICSECISNESWRLYTVYSNYLLWFWNNHCLSSSYFYIDVFLKIK